MSGQEELGGGTSSTVYRTERGTALKVTDFPDLYANEIEALERLQGCPHAPRLLGHWTEPPNLGYIEMELLQTKPSGGKRSAPGYEDFRRALRAIHRRGVLHNDVGRDNIMYRGRTPVIIDYGNADVSKWPVRGRIDFLSLRRDKQPQ